MSLELRNITVSKARLVTGPISSKTTQHNELSAAFRNSRKQGYHIKSPLCLQVRTKGKTGNKLPAAQGKTPSKNTIPNTETKQASPQGLNRAPRPMGRGFVGSSCGAHLGH